MGLFYLFLALTIIFLGLFVGSMIWVDVCGLEPLFGIVWALFTLISAVLAADGSDGDRIKDETETCERYELIMEKINAYDTDVNFRLLDELYSECKSMDEYIETNKRLYDSKWRGSLYSEKIGNMQPLVPIFEEKFNKKN